MRHSARGQRSSVRPAEMWVALLRALLALVLGVSVLAAGKTKPALANFVAVYWLLGSVLTLRWVLANRGRVGTRRALVVALVGAGAGIAVLLRSVLIDVVSRDTDLDLLGVAAVLTGVLRLSGGFHDDPVVDDRPRRRSRGVLGILEVILGAVLILAHGPTRPTAIAVGLWGLVAGAILLQDALAMRPRRHPSG